MDPRFARLKKAVSSRPFLMFIFFVVVLIVVTSIYLGLSNDGGLAGSEVYWYVAVAIVAIIAIIFLISAFICPSCMTPAREEAPDEPVIYHRNPERVSIGHDNYGADIQPDLQSVESSIHSVNENPISLVFGPADYSARYERSFSAPPGPGDWHTRSPRMWNSPMWNTPPTSYREPVGRAVAVVHEPASQFRSSRSLAFSEENTPSEPGNDRPHVAESSSPSPDTTDAVQDQPNVALADPSPPSPPFPYLPLSPSHLPLSLSGAGNEAGDEDEEPVLRYSTPPASPEPENYLNLKRAVSSSSSTHTGSSATIDSSSTLTSVSSLTTVSSEDGPSGPDNNARHVFESDSPFYTGQSAVESITAMQRISAERHSGLTFVHQSTRTPISLQRERGAGLHPSDALSDHGSIGNVKSSVNETPVPEEEVESVVASRVASPVPDEEIESVVASCFASSVPDEVESVVASRIASPVPDEEVASVVASRVESPVPEEEVESVVATRVASPVPDEEVESVVASRVASPVPDEEVESVAASRAASPVPEKEDESVVASRGASPVPEEVESVVASRVASPVPEEEGKEPASHSDVAINIDDEDEVETEAGLVLKLASSLLGAAWSSVSRWVRPQQERPTSVSPQASPGSPLSGERRIVEFPGSRKGEQSPEEVTASTRTRVNLAEFTEPNQQGEDVVPPEKRERP